MSIKSRILITFLAIAPLPLLIVNILSYLNYRNSIDSIRVAGLQDTAAFKADKIETYFEGLKSDLETSQSFYNIKKNLPILTQFANDPHSKEFISATKMLNDQLRPCSQFCASRISC